jgi:putative ABC transport system permease protein
MFSNMEILFNVLWFSVLIVMGVFIWRILRDDEPQDDQEQKQGVPSPFFFRSRLIWNNLWRKPFRTVLLLLSSALAAGILFLSYFFLHSLNRSLDVTGQRFGADVMVVPKGYGTVAQQILLSGTTTAFYMPDSILDTIRTIPEVDTASPQLYLETYSGSCCQVEGNFPVIAFDPATDFTLKPWLSNTGNRPFTPDSIMIGSEAGGKNAIYHLDYQSYEEHLTLFQYPFVVSHLLYPTGTGVDNTIFMDLRKAYQLRKAGNNGLHFPENSISVVLIKTRPGDEEFVKRQIERLLPEVSAVTGSGLRETVAKQLFPLRLLSYSMMGIVLAMAGLQAAALFTAIVSERKREIGMFRALGATKGTVFRFLTQEAALSGLLGGLAGTSLVTIALYDNRVLIRKTIQLPLLFPGWGMSVAIALAAILATILIGVTAAALPIWSIVNEDPYMAIREGE